MSSSEQLGAEVPEHAGSSAAGRAKALWVVVVAGLGYGS